jgi:hypothetical protein
VSFTKADGPQAYSLEQEKEFDLAVEGVDLVVCRELADSLLDIVSTQVSYVLLTVVYVSHVEDKFYTSRL